MRNARRKTIDAGFLFVMAAQDGDENNRYFTVVIIIAAVVDGGKGKFMFPPCIICDRLRNPTGALLTIIISERGRFP